MYSLHLLFYEWRYSYYLNVGLALEENKNGEEPGRSHFFVQMETSRRRSDSMLQPELEDWRVLTGHREGPGQQPGELHSLTISLYQGLIHIITNAAIYWQRMHFKNCIRQLTAIFNIKSFFQVYKIVTKMLLSTAFQIFTSFCCIKWAVWYHLGLACIFFFVVHFEMWDLVYEKYKWFTNLPFVMVLL